MTLDLEKSERDVLARLIEEAVAEIRVGVRRTRAPDFHDKLVGEEAILKGLLAKLRSE